MSDTCHTLVIRCADPRYSDDGAFEEVLEQILEAEGAQTHYLLTTFGGSLEFTKGQTTLGWHWRLGLAQRLGISKIVLIDHLDCAAFAAELGPLDPAAERAQHLASLKEARQFLELNASGLAVQCYLHDSAKPETV